MAKMDDALQQFMQDSISTQKNIDATFKRMEMQIGHIIERLEDFGVDTDVNPREECQAIIIGSDKTLDEKKDTEGKLGRRRLGVVNTAQRRSSRFVGQRSERFSSSWQRCCSSSLLVEGRLFLHYSSSLVEGKCRLIASGSLVEASILPIRLSKEGMVCSSGKRIKTIGSKRKDKEPERSYSSKFLSRKHECHFNIVHDRRPLMKRKAGLILDFAPQFGEQLENRNWERLATYPALANIAVVKEFYTNARRLSDHHTEEYMSYVRGHIIRYDPDAINRFLNTEWADE
ncbi:hypothetical protein LR48_Vigan01g087200 [Vigna angularis]|uniref:Putative plant transposon protein domain-containing protein n=1 Tax=Phaseolus angularis TaxID=3914 RepID=A0A0L9TLI4_PHAAN|nr:hypothetical protein LR48_Vigan01g087200 [Vigna angularis]